MLTFVIITPDKFEMHLTSTAAAIAIGFGEWETADPARIIQALQPGDEARFEAKEASVFRTTGTVFNS